MDASLSPPQWGSATWTLFHVAACAVNAEKFQTDHVFRTEFFEKLRIICETLPCPDCRTHAEQETKWKIQWQAVRSKRDLQWMLHAFHNRVNERTGKAIYNVNSLDLQYSPLVGRFYTSVLPVFHHEFSKPVRDIHFQNDNVRRLHVAEEVVSWFQMNKDLFSN